MSNDLPLIGALKKSLPLLFREINATTLSGGVLQTGTMQNERQRKDVPTECWSYDAAGCVVYDRDIYLDKFYTPKLKRKLERMGVKNIKSRLAREESSEQPTNLK
jgi:hypothetical protein